MSKGQRVKVKWEETDEKEYEGCLGLGDGMEGEEPGKLGVV